jgi:hypothetical protein
MGVRELSMTYSRLEYLSLYDLEHQGLLKRFTKMTVYEMYFGMMTRVMLTSFTSQTYTMINILIVSILQGFLRGTMRGRDVWYMALQGKQLSTGEKWQLWGTQDVAHK